MASNEILDNFPEGHKPRLTPFQRWVRVVSFVAWVAFLTGIFFDLNSWPANFGPVSLIALVVLSVLYIFLPIPLFRSKGMSQHLFAHWVAAMMLGFLLGYFLKYESWPQAHTVSLVSGIGSLVGLTGLFFFLVKNELRGDERRFWLSMLIRLTVIAFLTAGPLVDFARRYIL